MILRYTASADNTITNAYKEDMTTRGTGSNAGAADSLQVFGIYAQESSSSAELSRALIKFPTTAIASDRAASKLPASGDVDFFLKLYNVRHPETLPEDYKLTIARVTNDWEEGYGLDLENHTDLTYDGIGSSWINANGTFVSASFTMSLQGGANKAAMSGQTFSLTDSAGSSQTFTFNIANNTVTDGTIGMQSDSNTTDMINTIKSAINDSSLSNLDITASTITAVGDADSEMRLLIAQKSSGYAGNTSVDLSGVAHLSVLNSAAGFTGGSGTWETVGGDYSVGTDDFVDVSFSDGDEDIEVNITTIVENWIKDSNPNANYGLLIKLSSSYETYYSSSTGDNTGSLLHNLDGAKRSYYTKRFSGRGTEFFFKRPVIEARWDDSRRDDRGNIFLSSSLVPAADNLNKLYLYNYVGGKLTDIKGSNSELPNLKLYYSSGSTPEGLPRSFIHSNASKASVNATRESTGLYSVSFAINDDQFPTGYSYLVDVWSHEAKEIHTGSAMLPKARGFSNSNPNSQYVLSVSNMRDFYNPRETARFRVFIREKDWSPTVYSKASKAIEPHQIVSASYEIYRVVDEEVVVPYGTGSSQHTRLSYDVSGNYFDLSMKLLEPGYMYGIRISIYEDSIGSYREQPYTFKFKVKRHYDDY